MRTVASLLAFAVVLAIVTPAAILGWRLADTWTADMTGQLLGGFLAVCGGSGAILAVLVGAGLFARLAGWRAPRPDLPTPPAIEGQWRELPTTPALPAPTPPWGMTGGGSFDVLPAPRQDARFTYTLEAPRTSTREE